MEAKSRGPSNSRSAANINYEKSGHGESAQIVDGYLHVKKQEQENSGKYSGP